MKEKSLLIIRGLPGAGKSSLGKILKDTLDFAVFDFDDYIKSTGDFTKARKEWQFAVEEAIKRRRSRIVVVAVFCEAWERKWVKELAEKHKYKTFQIVVENIHGTQPTTPIPETSWARYAERFVVQPWPVKKQEV